MITVKGIDIGVELCEVLGLSEQDVISVDIHIRTDEAVEIKIVKFAQLADVKEVIKLISKYQLIEITTNDEYKKEN